MIRSAALILALSFAAPAATAEIIYPPAREPEAAEPKQTPIVVVLKQKIVVKVKVKHGESRSERRRRALFQNWTGFRKVYSGPQYPF